MKKDTILRKNVAPVALPVVNLDDAWEKMQKEISARGEALLRAGALAAFNEAAQAYQAELEPVTIPELPAAMGRKDKELIKYLAGRAPSAEILANYFQGRNSVNQKNYAPDVSFGEFLKGKITVNEYLKGLGTSQYGAVVRLSKGRTVPTAWYQKHQPVLVALLQQVGAID